MKKVFADAFFFLALMSKRDLSHQRAVEVADAIPGLIVTTHWVLVEVADAFCQPRDRALFAKLLSLIDADKRMHVVTASKALFERGSSLFMQRPDKAWSLTDCMSFVVMDQHNIRDALTGDHHFAQAGFVPLLGDAPAS